MVVWIKYSIYPKSLSEQAPQIARPGTILPIMVQNADICWCNMPWIDIQYPQLPPQQAVYYKMVYLRLPLRGSFVILEWKIIAMRF
jgi:hypothetical protein